MLHPAVLIFLASSLIVESLISYSIHTTTLPIPQVVSGKAVLNMLSYMQEFSIHMFRQTDNFSPPARDNTKISRNKHIKPRVLKLSIAPPLSSSYRYFFLEVWGMSPLSATKRSLLWSPPNETNPPATPALDAACHSQSHACQPEAQEVFTLLEAVYHNGSFYPSTCYPQKPNFKPPSITPFSILKLFAKFLVYVFAFIVHHTWLFFRERYGSSPG